MSGCCMPLSRFHVVFDKAFIEHAYEDKAFQIGSGQTISQPYTVAYQSQALQATPGMKVLEIGTGSGYQAAVLAEMGLRYSVLKGTGRCMRNHEKCWTVWGTGRSRPLWRRLCRMACFRPFDRVIVTAAARKFHQLW